MSKRSWSVPFAAALLACQGDPVGSLPGEAGAGAGGASAAAGAAGQAGAAGAAASGGSAGGAASGGTAGSGASGGSAGAAASGGGGAAGAFGPGPHGALPAGYCCTSDLECRYRTCLDVGGVKVCSDPCSTNDGCVTAGGNMQCNTSTQQCEPVGVPTCTPAAQWPLGQKKAGACCFATGDGWSGQECEGNRCAAFGDLSNPYICTQACEKATDCPPGKYECKAGAGICWPLASLYTCD